MVAKKKPSKSMQPAKTPKTAALPGVKKKRGTPVPKMKGY
jgi:hypothetical protein